MDKIRRNPSRYALRLIETTFALVFLGAVAHHILALDFKPLAAFCLPILVVLYGFASRRAPRRFTAACWRWTMTRPTATC